jgi:nucleoside-diphosphate-sugar epimerase
MIEKDVDVIVKELEKGNVSFEDSRVLVTGGAGFLGSWICDVLVKQGAEVTCLDNFSSGLRSNIEHLIDKENFTFV